MKTITFLSGGNPPIAPGLFYLAAPRGKGSGKRSRMSKRDIRIAWWPAGFAPTEERVTLVEVAYEAKGATLTRDEVRALLTPEIAP